MSAPGHEDTPLRRLGVLIAEDDPAMQVALGAVVSADPGLDLQGMASDADGVIELAARLRPQVCIVDVTMPGGGGPRAAREIRSRSPWTRVVALSGHQDRATVVEMLRAGASAYLVKGASADEIVEAIYAVADGSRALSKQVADGVLGELTEKLALEEETADARRRDLARIERALREDLLSVAYQPIVDLGSRLTVGFEALARFDDEPFAPPDAWFAKAAGVDRLIELEIEAVRAALRGLDHLPRHAFLSLNVSPAAAASRELVTAFDGIDLRRIVIEITEHAPVEDYAVLVPRLDELRARGARLAIDDAGAGFASLRHILRLGPDIIKTDITLTRNIATSRAERALTTALISFAAEMDAVIVAEGIESQADIEALRDLGVPLGQGYHLGRPAPVEAPAGRSPSRLDDWARRARFGA